MAASAEDGVCQPLKDDRGFSLPTGAPAAPPPHRRAAQAGGADAALGAAASASRLPDFSWPPPAPTERVVLQRKQMLASPAPAHPSLADVGDHLIAALQAAGYSEYSVYAVPGGFAIVTRLERVEADGTPSAAALRFQAPDAAASGGLGRLFGSPKGYYRQIVLIANADIIPPGAAPGPQTAADLLQGGASRLTAGYRKTRLTDDYQVAALIYEYQKAGADGGLKGLTVGHNDALTNLARSGVYPALASAGP